jgi:hypothetical protein
LGFAKGITRASKRNLTSSIERISTISACSKVVAPLASEVCFAREAIGI